MRHRGASTARCASNRGGDGGAPLWRPQCTWAIPGLCGQLVSGFHGIEANAWRWTMRQFSVYLRPPLGSAQKGAVLIVNLTVPPAVIETEKTISLSASVKGNRFAPET